MKRAGTTKEKMTELAGRLLANTEAGQISWEEGLGANAYNAYFPDSSVSIESNKDGSSSFTLRLINHQGTVIEVLTPAILLPPSDTLEQLYDLARRQVLDIDGAIEKTLEYLGRGSQ